MSKKPAMIHIGEVSAEGSPYERLFNVYLGREHFDWFGYPMTDENIGRCIRNVILGLDKLAPMTGGCCDACGNCLKHANDEHETDCEWIMHHA